MGDRAAIIETSILKITSRASTYNFPCILTGKNGRGGKTVRKESVSIFFFFFLLDVGDMAKQSIEKGLLVPDHVITRLMMSELESRRGQHWLLDGELSPRVSWTSADSALRTLP